MFIHDQLSKGRDGETKETKTCEIMRIEVRAGKKYETTNVDLEVEV